MQQKHLQSATKVLVIKGILLTCTVVAKREVLLMEIQVVSLK